MKLARAQPMPVWLTISFIYITMHFIQAQLLLQLARASQISSITAPFRGLAFSLLSSIWEFLCITYTGLEPQGAETRVEVTHD